MTSNVSSPNPGRDISTRASPSLPTDASPQDSPIAERPSSPDLPLTMTASTVLMNLPRDATAALAAAGGFPVEKVVVRFRPVGGATPTRNPRVRVMSTQKFEDIVMHVRKNTKVRDTDSVFLYINQTFAPALDEVVGNLWRCFKDANNELNVSYSMTPAFG